MNARRRVLIDGYVTACRLELAAPKPGNVQLASAGHGMCAEDFLRSAAASAAPLTHPRHALGERMFAAVAATRQAVGCNTNLGIVLLCAPMLHAALQCARGRSWRAALSRVLARTTVADAEACYRAIRLADPGGLGRSERHDVRETPLITLLEAMRHAANRDRIAWQFANGYADIFELALPLLRRRRRQFARAPLALAVTYLGLLARRTDTHVERKFGVVKAERTRRRAAAALAAIEQAPHEAAVLVVLAELDGVFKHEGLNPGTTADIVVATLLAEWLDGLPEFSESRLIGSFRQAIAPAFSTQQRNPLEVNHG
ncbi:MAG: triphosphoribosyl-dephospho-CoA synthase [Thiotrichales bacterium]